MIQQKVRGAAAVDGGGFKIKGDLTLGRSYCMAGYGCTCFLFLLEVFFFFGFPIEWFLRRGSYSIV